MEINFKDNMSVKTNSTFYHLLKEKQYYFKPINKYDDKHYYCFIRNYMNENKVDKFFKKIDKIININRDEKFKYFDSVLSITLKICENNCNYFNDEPVVFTREEITNMISEAPENYIGENTI